MDKNKFEVENSIKNHIIDKIKQKSTSIIDDKIKDHALS